MKWSRLSHTGLVRKNNEDSSCVYDDIPLLAVADGMGGHQAGEIASHLALDALADYLKESKEALAANPQNVLNAGIKAANKAVYEFSRKDGGKLKGMGTTITALVPEGDKAYIAHVGDSRAYKVSHNRIKLLTVDHSLVNELVKSGGISQEEAEHHPQKNILTRAIGTSPDVEVDIDIEPIEPGDLFLLCTDGLSNQVNLDEIRDMAESPCPLGEKVKNLIEKALDRGGDDNITVVIYQVE